MPVNLRKVLPPNGKTGAGVDKIEAVRTVLETPPGPNHHLSNDTRRAAANGR
jgi:hypothetical protein